MMKRLTAVCMLTVVLFRVHAWETYDITLDYSSLGEVPAVTEIGDFHIYWDSDAGLLTVRHADNPGRVLWQTLPGEGFVAGALAEADIEEQRGFFTIEDHKLDVLDHQELNEWVAGGGQLTLSGVLRGDSLSAAYTLVFTEAAASHLAMRLEVAGPVNRTYLNYALDDAGIFGFGAQCSHFNHRGNRVGVLVQEQGIGRGDIDNPLIDLVLGTATGDDYTSYISVPQYATSGRNLLFLENREISYFDFTEEGRAQVEVFSGNLNARIVYGRDFPGLMEAYTEYAGRMRRLPDWAISGAIVGLQGGTAKVYDVWQKLRDAGTPLAAFWIQDWVGQRTTIVGRQLWWNWELDEARYPEYDALLDSLTRNGIALMGYINPFLVNVYRQKEYRRNQFVEAHSNGYFARRDDGFPYLVEQTSFSSGILDLSNPETETWIKEIITDELLARGFRGWMADFGEALPFDVTLEDADPATYHNAYAEEWARINREAVEEAGFGEDIVFFSRSGYTQSPGQSTLFWLGDQMVNWGENDGIRSAVTGLLSGGMSGFSLNHSDIGGYATINFEPFVPLLARDAELLRRWTEMNAFSAVFRTHEGLGPDLNHQVYSDDESVAHFARWAKVYQAWLPYRRQLVDEAAATGMPVVRHPVMHYPDDAEVLNLSWQQFLVGDQFMVAPVLEPGAVSATIYLPAGNWVNLWTGEAVASSGAYFEVTGLEDRPAVFYVEGSAAAADFIQEMINLGVYD